MFKIIAKEDKARTGILKTAHGEVETPFFMPVATKMAVKYLTAEDLIEIGVKVIISNAFVLSLKPGLKALEQHGGIHKMMHFPHAIFTDSGGFQKIRKSFFIKSSHEGVHFKSPFDGTKHLLTPEKAMDIEQSIGSDIAMCIDEMPLYSENKQSVAAATEKTHTWALKCLKHHKKINTKGQLLFGIAQGGTFPDLREKSAKFIGALDFDGFAFGGLAIGEPSEDMYNMINLQVSHFPENKPRYLMGVGSPIDIINAVANGVDCFDSTFPTQNARHAALFTSEGKLRLDKAEYEFDMNPIDKNCNCKVCKTYTRSFIRHLLRTQEPNGLYYATYHNISFMTNMMKQAREAIKENRFKEFREDFLKNFKQ